MHQAEVLCSPPGQHLTCRQDSDMLSEIDSNHTPSLQDALADAQPQTTKDQQIFSPAAISIITQRNPSGADHAMDKRAKPDLVQCFSCRWPQAKAASCARQVASPSAYQSATLQQVEVNTVQSACAHTQSTFQNASMVQPCTQSPGAQGGASKFV